MMGFGFVLPFLPSTSRSSESRTDGAAGLDRRDLGSHGLIMGAAAPIWGLLADKHGRKLMLLRAMGAGAISMAALAFAPNVQVVFVLRLLSGLFAGTIAAATTLVAVGTPRRHISYAMGFIASAAFIGHALGPRSAACVRVARLPAHVLHRRGHHGRGISPRPRVRRRSARGAGRRGLDRSRHTIQCAADIQQPFLPMFVAFFALRLARTLPGSFVSLYIQELRGTIQGSSALTGALSGVVGVLTGLSGMMFARFGDRHDKLRLLTVFVGLGAASALPIFFLPGSWSFVGFYVLSAVFLGPSNRCSSRR